MPRRPAGVQGGMAFGAINGGNCRMAIFEKDQEHLAFLKLVEEGRRRVGMRIVACCLMPNQWHPALNV